MASYADKADTRYGFIITDRKLTVITFRREVISAGIGATRPRRTHERVVPNESQLSSSVKAMSLGSSDPDIETSSGLAMHAAYHDIPWSAYGRKTLMVRLGLFFLCLLAGYDDRSIQSSYYDLETFAPATYMREKNRDMWARVMNGGETMRSVMTVGRKPKQKDWSLTMDWGNFHERDWVPLLAGMTRDGYSAGPRGESGKGSSSKGSGSNIGSSKPDSSSRRRKRHR